MPFSEKLQRERYHPHIGLFNQVKSSENGALKYARLLSEIYKGTMWVFLPYRISQILKLVHKGEPSVANSPPPPRQSQPGSLYSTQIPCQFDYDVVRPKVSVLHKNISFAAPLKIYVDTGGKGQCSKPVHHKYIARKWTKYHACTCPAHHKYIQNFPCQ